MDDLLDSFYDLTNIRCVFFDTENRIICSSGSHTEFCKLVTNSDQFVGRCIADDAANMRKASSLVGREMYIYRCYCGIMNVIFPITDAGMTYGYMMFGQFISDDDIESQWTDTWSSLSEAGDMNRNRLQRAFDKLPVLTTEKIASCSKILEACATYIRIEGLTDKLNMSDYEKLEYLIQQNYMKQLSLDTLAGMMNISKSKLCATAQKHDTTVSKMINDYRMRIASHMLTATSKKISEIAPSVGISDINYFSKVFKASYGRTPREYRRDGRKNKN